MLFLLGLCFFSSEKKGNCPDCIIMSESLPRRLQNHVDKPARLQVDNLLLLLSNNSPSVLSFSLPTQQPPW